MIFRITLHFPSIIITNASYAITLVGAVFLFTPRFGLVGIGMAWGFGNLIELLVGASFLSRINLGRRKLRQQVYSEVSAQFPAG